MAQEKLFLTDQEFRDVQMGYLHIMECAKDKGIVDTARHLLSALGEIKGTISIRNAKRAKRILELAETKYAEGELTHEENLESLALSKLFHLSFSLWSRRQPRQERLSKLRKKFPKLKLDSIRSPEFEILSQEVKTLQPIQTDDGVLLPILDEYRGFEKLSDVRKAMEESGELPHSYEKCALIRKYWRTIAQNAETLGAGQFKDGRTYYFFPTGEHRQGDWPLTLRWQPESGRFLYTPRIGTFYDSPPIPSNVDKEWEQWSKDASFEKKWSPEKDVAIHLFEVPFAFQLPPSLSPKSKR